MRFKIIALVFLIFGCQNSNEKKSNISEGMGIWKGVVLEDLEGNQIDILQYDNKIVIINFWATWCKPCIAEMPSLQDMQSTLDSNKYVLLLASDESSEKIKKFKSGTNFNFNYIKIASGYESVGVYSLPTTLITKTNGKVLMTEKNAIEWNSLEVINKIEALSK